MANVESPADASASYQQRRDAALEDDSDLDPAAFLKSVRELSEKREREDLERYRKLEEEVRKGREERAARKADRARSISPRKQNSTVSTPTDGTPTRVNPNATLLNSPPIKMTPPSSAAESGNIALSHSAAIEPSKMPEKDIGIPEFKGFGSIKRSSTVSSRASQSSEPYQSPDPTPTLSASGLARSGTLSWQQRPRPGSSLRPSRPQSMIAIESRGSHTRERSIDEPEPNRDQIAASLGAKDPTWFKQTAERGIGNAAYRKSKDGTTQSESVSAGRRGLAGMSREPSPAQQNHGSPPMSPGFRTGMVSRDASARESTVSSSSRYSVTSTASNNKPDLKALIEADQEQRRVSPSFSQATMDAAGSSGLDRIPDNSSVEARLRSATERPSSPTKGMGGFVQSAMMKRSDSQSKRWSAQPSSTLSRTNPTTSARNHVGTLTESYSMPSFEQTSASGATKNEAISRPISSSNNDLVSLSQASDLRTSGFAKPAVLHHRRSKSVASNYSENEDGGASQTPGSPSKRWSPNKSSWLESSLTRPESPSLAPSKNSQPSWMTDLARAKAQRTTTESPQGAAPQFGQDDTSKAPSRPGSPLKTTSSAGQAIFKQSDTTQSRTFSQDTTQADQLSSLRSSDKVNASSLAATIAYTKPIESPLPKPLAKPANLEVSKDSSSPSKIHTFQPSRDVPPSQSPAAEEPLREEPTRVPELEPSTRSSTLPAQTASNAETIVVSPKRSSTSETFPLEKPEQQSSTTIKPQTDFRSPLKPRAAPPIKSQEEPEFLAKFGNLRKAQQEKYVAPDVLKGNILRGKSGLAQTGGPVKAPKRDELKESLLARKDDIKKAKEEGRDLPGQAHERKVSSGSPQTPPKPEALARRDTLGRADNARVAVTGEKAREATPEALTRYKSLSQKASQNQARAEKEDSTVPRIEALHKTISAPSPVASNFDNLRNQRSTPVVTPTKQLSADSKLASRFNPQLANILARGPPSATPQRSEPAVAVSTPKDEGGESPAAGAPLQDMRKDRAKGPKRRKGTDRSAVDSYMDSPPVSAEPVRPTSSPATKTKPLSTFVAGSPVAVATPNSSSTQMSTRLDGQGSESQIAAKPASPFIKPKPSFPALGPSAISLAKSGPDPTTKSPAVPDFKGFGVAQPQSSSLSFDDDKENSTTSTSTVKSATSQWQRRPSPTRNDVPSQIQLPTTKDEEAALRSAGLLASVDKASNKPPAAPTASTNLPVKPVKSSRTVSGQLAETSSNRGFISSTPIVGQPMTEAGRLLIKAFKSIPKYKEPLAIDTSAIVLLASQGKGEQSCKTLRRSVHMVLPNGSTKPLSPQDEYILFDESVYTCTHVYVNATGTKSSQLFLWCGTKALEATIEAANTSLRQSSAPHLVKQGLESAEFIAALGGILATRRGRRENASKQFMLCGRKHLGHIVFDEVDLVSDKLCSKFVYLISWPTTLQETKLYLWKGQGCNPEGVSAARLAAMDLGETRDIIEIDEGQEPPSFLKIFGSDADKSLPPNTTAVWQQLAASSRVFEPCLYRVQVRETKASLFTSLWSRRPSWNSISAARPSSSDANELRVEVQRVEPFTQALLDADGIYMLDAFSKLYILIGPLLGSHPESVWSSLLGQTLLYASDYATMAASMEDRSGIPKCQVLFGDAPRDLKMLFRHWDRSRGLWGTASLMAGSALNAGGDVQSVSLEDMLTEVCRD